MKSSGLRTLLIVTLHVPAVVVSAQQNHERNGPGILGSNVRRDLEPELNRNRKQRKGKKGKGKKSKAPTEAPEDVKLLTPSPSVEPTEAVTSKQTDLLAPPLPSC